MPKVVFESARISGLVACVPPDEVSIDDEVHLFGGNLKQIARIKKTIGLDKRRIAADGVTALDLCESASRHLIREAGIDESEIDAIVFVTQTPDHSQPSNAAILHGRLGLEDNCAAFDVGLGCSGYVYGLWLAHMMVSGGGCSRVLLLAGDTLSRVVSPEDRAVAPLFGDGGSATFVEKSDGKQQSWFSLETDGTGFEHLIVPAGGARKPASDWTRIVVEDDAGNRRSEEDLFMDGAEVFNFSIKVEPKAVRDILEFARFDIGEVDHFVFHQANRYILCNIAKRLKLNLERVPLQTVEQYGNQSSASIPCAICGELKESFSKKPDLNLVLSGFGVGLSWATCLLSVKDLSACEIIEYNG